MSNDDSSLPFDPADVSPTELVASKYSGLKRFLDENSRVVLLCATALIIAAMYIGVSLPTLPNWALVGLGAFVAAAPPTFVVSRQVSKWLFSPDYVLVSQLNAVSGDQRLKRLSPDRFDEMTVENHNGVERDHSFLHKETINGVRAYEVDRYYPEENRAVASWQAGATNADIRRSKSEIKRIKTSLEEEADKALELLANHPDILRAQGREVSNRIIRVAEGVEVPGGGELHQNLSDRLDEMDPSEDLLDGMTDGEGDDGDDVDVDPDEMDIFGRAMQTAQSMTNGHSNGNKSNGDSNE